MRPTHGTFHCFGCGEGGDVIKFIMQIEKLSFVESVERLADRAGFRLTYEGGGGSVQRDRGTRTRMVEAHRIAAKFYAEQLNTPEGQTAREFLTQRGFDQAAAATFGCGFAPAGWDKLTKLLLNQGFELKELITAGLVKEGRQGPIDRFHRRLLWPIKDLSGDVVGFGARRLFDDDRIEAKYLNTSETPIYHKSEVLFGLDMAKREISKRHQVVVVEGYTDVMAMHAAGVPTAVASSGTAFGQDHMKVLRRLLMDDDAFRGEVIFTFDGDEAGQKAALKAFEGDQTFAGQTYIAIAPDGMDPCELRLAKGTRRSRTWSPGAPRCSSSRSAACCAGTTSTRWTARSPPCATPCRWWPRSRTGPSATGTRRSCPGGSAGRTRRWWCAASGRVRARRPRRSARRPRPRRPRRPSRRTCRGPRPAIRV